VKIYAVGGAVRDELLGLPVKDRDYVVVGASPDEMLARGFRPVGRDFPVFLHPQTHEEYALARTERKTGKGYHGFQFYADRDVTLEQDLMRRDLTINAIAKTESGELIDPFGGAKDLAAGILRHVGPAFVEDPVRVLRVARFASRLGFSVAPETMALMRAMVESGEVDHLVAERVWQEIARGLMEKSPRRMIDVLRTCGALVRVLPEVERLFGVPQPPAHHPEIDTGEHILLALECAAARGEPLEVRFALLVHDLGKAGTPPEALPQHIGHETRSLPMIEQLCIRLRVPNACRELALLTARFHTHVHRALELKPATLLNVLERADAFRRHERFESFLNACECDARGRAGLRDRPYPQADRMRLAARAARTIDQAAIVRDVQATRVIPERIRHARIAAIRGALR
jgi:tRNA nucleotidyltransferase (CCA-adding enzyme)